MVQPSVLQSSLDFVMVVGSLQVSYLIWGVMQESIMHTVFEPTPLNPSGIFPSATFCVFSNRVVAIIVAYIACKRVHGTVHSPAPLLSFTPSSLSNTISSWAQYQALTYVSFSLQTLFKATKVIPVMIMGYVLRGASHKVIEYLEALIITIGVAIFSSSTSKGGHGSLHKTDGIIATSMSDISSEWLGYLCLVTYVVCDAFTSQWQSKLYEQHGKIDHWHMMFGINVSSVCKCSISLFVPDSNDCLGVFIACVML
jgi:adenosine 3'-phospho 5'-phosphosulfate transporter B2